jgi:hypothetical protein
MFIHAALKVVAPESPVINQPVAMNGFEAFAKNRESSAATALIKRFCR